VIANSLWLMAYGRWLMVNGLSPIAYGKMVDGALKIAYSE
jgi:hypothetical protein